MNLFIAIKEPRLRLVLTVATSGTLAVAGGIPTTLKYYPNIRTMQKVDVS